MLLTKDQKVKITTQQADPTILIVDDDLSIAQMLEMLLEDDYAVEICLKSVEALEHARRLQPNLIMVDVMMPHLNGIEVLTQLRKDSISVPVILMSAGNNYLGYKAHEIRQLNAYITKKPFNNMQLLELIEQKIT